MTPIPVPRGRTQPVTIRWIAITITQGVKMRKPTSDEINNRIAPGVEAPIEAPIDAPIDADTPFPPIHRLGVSRVFAWLRLGWRDLSAAPLVSLFYGLCFAGMGLFLRVVLANTPQYLSALTCGLLLIGPVLSLGLYDISRRLEHQEPPLLSSLFAVRGRWNNIGVLAVVQAVILLLWVRASLMVFALFYNKGMPTLQGFLSQLFSFDNIQFLAIYCCVGLLFAGIVFAISWVAIPLMLDRDTDAITAMLISTSALFTNLPVAIVWGAIIVSFVVFGFFTWNLGFIVAMPLVGHATWHAYREVLGPAAASDAAAVMGE